MLTVLAGGSGRFVDDVVELDDETDDSADEYSDETTDKRYFKRNNH